MYLVSWASGDTPPKPVYYRETKEGYPCATYDRAKAKRFETRRKALNAWLSIHARPSDYIHCIKEGLVRAELDTEPELCLGAKK